MAAGDFWMRAAHAFANASGNSVRVDHACEVALLAGAAPGFGRRRRASAATLRARLLPARLERVRHAPQRAAQQAALDLHRHASELALERGRAAPVEPRHLLLARHPQAGDAEQRVRAGLAAHLVGGVRAVVHRAADGQAEARSRVHDAALLGHDQRVPRQFPLAPRRARSRIRLDLGGGRRPMADLGLDLQRPELAALLVGRGHPHGPAVALALADDAPAVRAEFVHQRFVVRRHVPDQREPDRESRRAVREHRQERAQARATRDLARRSQQPVAVLGLEPRGVRRRRVGQHHLPAPRPAAHRTPRARGAAPAPPRAGPPRPARAAKGGPARARAGGSPSAW